MRRSAAPERIEQTISEIDSITSSIAAAVEQQGAATATIAQTVSGTAVAVNAMTQRITEVTVEAETTDHSTEKTRDEIRALDKVAGELRHAINRMVRTATVEVDRRSTTRYAVERPCRMSKPGMAPIGAHTVSISAGGAAVRGGPTLAPGTRGTLEIDRVGAPLPFIVRSASDDTLHLEFADPAAAGVTLAPLLQQSQDRRAA